MALSTYTRIISFRLLPLLPPIRKFLLSSKKAHSILVLNLTPQNDFRHGDYSVLEMMNNAISEKVFEDEDSELFFHLALNGGDGSDKHEDHDARQHHTPNLEHLGRQHCVQLNEVFSYSSLISGKNLYNDHNNADNHVVFSFEALGPTLDDLRQTFVPARLPISYVKTIAKQVLLALDYIHEECGIVHCSK